jgi:hypothetical protein
VEILVPMEVLVFHLVQVSDLVIHVSVIEKLIK